MKQKRRKSLCKGCRENAALQSSVIEGSKSKAGTIFSQTCFLADPFFQLTWKSISLDAFLDAFRTGKEVVEELLVSCFTGK